ncbi:unnamed protein product [Miscanthus lutarioriparius]|uniref:Uncharacterized protein n=1 Tax=Miscanthus lutarioriparius TaxID=422564 RepID=A0A811S0U2_9POAL|nr:unnamed protein product [Miscanthus lutarioriparius]
MSKGLEMILRCHNFDVKPEMVNDEIVETNLLLFMTGDLVVKKHSRSLHMSDSDLMEISGFNSQDWDTMKIATAMKMIAYPDEKVEHPPEMFSKDELSKIQKDASKYNDKIIKHDVAKVFEELVRAKRCKEIKVTLMRHLVREATLMVGETANKRLNQADD